MPYPVNKGQGKRPWTTGNEPQYTRAGMGKNTSIALLVGLTLASFHLAEAQQPIKVPRMESIINLKAAKQIGLTFPPNVLARADKIIR
jgi:hypothetical protein